jgi:XRE family transcriptional regulator, regulator of sulfur utilization
MARKPPTKRIRAADVRGDEVGAADLARRIAGNVRTRRQQRNMSLDDLANASGVSRAALSQIETNKTNPTLGVVWKIAVGFGIPFSELLGEDAVKATVLRRGDAQVLKSADGKFESRPLTPAGTSPLIEAYELRLLPRAIHASEAHAPGTHEVVIVLSGAMRIRVDDQVHQLAAGDSIAFAADRPHAYENAGTSESRCHDLIVYRR